MLGHGKGVPIGWSVEELASHGLGYASSYTTWTLPNIRSWKSGDFRGLCHSGVNVFFVQFQRPTKMTNHLWDGSLCHFALAPCLTHPQPEQTCLH